MTNVSPNAAPLLIRADANVAIGTGHVMRCLALAQAWQDAGGSVTFAAADITPAVEARLVAESCAIEPASCAAGTEEDWRRTIALAAEKKADWVVVDGYQFGADYQRALKAKGLKILFLDDYGHAPNYSADFVLNQNPAADESLYSNREPNTRLLLGSSYCLLRREFSAWGNWKREVSPVVHSVLVTMGGSDPEGLTARAVEALGLAGTKGLDVTVMIGGSNPHFDLLQSMAAKQCAKIRVRHDISDVAEVMAVADVAIAAAGSTCWELSLLGLPALLIDVAANQTALAQELHRRECAIHVGDRNVSARKIADEFSRLVSSLELRQSLSHRSRALVDGKGAARVVSSLRNDKSVRLRRVRADDIHLLWKWANDPEVREASFSAASIPWEAHVAWFQEKFGSSFMLVCENEQGVPFAQVRFDLNGSEAELNISISKEKRGCGLAVPVIEAAVRELFANNDCKRVHAFVKRGNEPSARAFKRAGFVPMGVKEVRGNTALHFVWARN